jgi:hypothetical protein
MSHVDQNRHEIVVDCSKQIKFNKQDSFRVFGIHSASRRVVENCMPIKETLARISKDYLGIQVRWS